MLQTVVGPLSQTLHGLMTLTVMRHHLWVDLLKADNRYRLVLTSVGMILEFQLHT